MTFDDVIGQQEAKQRLQIMYGSGKMPHALLLCGPAGVGKMALAMALACHVLRQSAKNNVEAMLEKMEHPDKFDPREYLKPARANIKELVRHKLVDVLGCAGKA